MKACALIFAIFLHNSLALAWGERGHHLVGEAAALLVGDLLDTPEDKSAVGDFFKTRSIAMGHLNNIPDISWRAQSNPKIQKLNGPTHYFDYDVLSESPSESDLSRWPSEYRKMRSLYSEKQLEDAGSAPWRVQQLYESALVLGRCLKTVENQSNEKFKDHLLSGRGDKIIKKIKCPHKPNADAVALAYTSVLGIMGHFIADLGQPYHATKDHDGWGTEQGGIHSYFETDVVQELDPGLLGKVVQSARGHLKNISKDQAPFQMALRLGLDSYHQIGKVRDLDRQFALLEKSKDKTKAKRESAASAKIQKAFEALVVERLAISAAQLALLHYKNWKESGAPLLRSRSRIAAPYPFELGFIVPTYLN